MQVGEAAVGETQGLVGVIGGLCHCFGQGFVVHRGDETRRSLGEQTGVLVGEGQGLHSHITHSGHRSGVLGLRRGGEQRVVACSGYRVTSIGCRVVYIAVRSGLGGENTGVVAVAGVGGGFAGVEDVVAVGLDAVGIGGTGVVGGGYVGGIGG